MSIFNLIRIALKALQRNKLRALLTMLGIIIGVAAVIVMIAIGEGSKRSIRAQLSNMGSNVITINPQSNLPGGVRIIGTDLQILTIEDVEILRSRAAHVSAVSPVSHTSGQAIKGSRNWPTRIEGVSPEYLDIRLLSLKDGVMFSRQHVRSFAKVCLLGQTVVDHLFPNGEDPVGQVIRFNKIPFQVIGVLQPKQNAFGLDQGDVIIAPYTTVQKRILATVYLRSIYASATSEEESPAATEEITGLLRKAHRLKPEDQDDFSIRTMQDLIEALSSTAEMMTALLTAVAAISLVIGGIGIMNIMYVSVTERTREIGLRMSIGARGGDILLQFLIEAVVLSIAGGIIGVMLGLITSGLIVSLLGWPTVITPSSIAISFLVCTVTGIFFGYYPARKASKSDPIEALRYE